MKQKPSDKIIISGNGNTLKRLTSADDIAAADTLDRHGICVRIIGKNDGDFLLVFEDGEVSMRGVPFRGLHELDVLIRADSLKVGYEFARGSLIKKFIASCVGAKK